MATYTVSDPYGVPLGTVEILHSGSGGAVVPWADLLKIDEVRAVWGLTSLYMNWVNMTLYTISSGIHTTAFRFHEIQNRPKKRVIPDVRECPQCLVPTKMFPPASITCPQCRRTFGGC